jgi:SAM-dependent methyltransferase
VSLSPDHATAFEAVVDDYDAGRPSYPPSLYAALPPLAGRRVLELGAGTGLGTAGLLAAGADVVATDRGPRMLARLHAAHPPVPVAVARAETLPFADGSFDGVCGAQMWHWVDVAAAAAQVSRVLRPGGWLAVWWNDVAARGEPWFEAQQQRLEAASPGYVRGYRSRPYDDELRAHLGDVRTWSGTWTRTLDLATYEQWLRSKSYVQALPDLDGFLAEERASLRDAFPDGVVVEPFEVTLMVARRP